MADTGASAPGQGAAKEQYDLFTQVEGTAGRFANSDYRPSLLISPNTFYQNDFDSQGKTISICVMAQSLAVQLLANISLPQFM